MNIGVDIRMFARATHSGVEEYTLNLLSHIISAAPQHTFHLFYNAFHKVPLSFPWATLPNVRLIKKSIPNKFIEYSTFLFDEPKIDRFLGDMDIFLSPHFIPTALRPGTPRVTVFHDLSFEYYPDFFSFRKRLWHAVIAPRKQAARSAVIIATSESTKRDLMRLYGVPESKITVVYQAHDGSFAPVSSGDPRMDEVRKKYDLPAQYILHLATIEPRKNLSMLIKAHRILRRQQKNVPPLVIAGQKGWLYENVLKNISGEEDSIRYIGKVDAKDRVFLYNGAVIFVYPSFFEGFGLPPLEAMACGVPTVISQSSSLPEVAGDAALSCSSSDPDALVFLLSELLAKEELRAMLSKKGRERSLLFHWDSAARQIIGILEQAALSGRNGRKI
jgi:glycosyltransferase involved in cell wall biosynthesis